MKKAIVLEAGEGKRLRPLTNSLPKCLLRLNEKTILEHQLENLIESGIREIVLVVGYHSERIIGKMDEWDLDLALKYIHNPIYYKTNTVYSLWLAKNEMNEDFIFLNGDVLFHKDALRRLIASRHETCLAIQSKSLKEEEVKVRAIDNRIMEIGKKIKPSEAQGEFIGLARFSAKVNDVFKDKLDEVVAEGKIKAFFEVAVTRMLKNHEIFAVDVSDLPCIEIDTYEDFCQAKEIYPVATKRKSM